MGEEEGGDGPVAAPCWASWDPACLARPPSRSARYLARPRDALYPLIDAESLGFVIQQLIVSIPPRGEAVRAWPFLCYSFPWPWAPKKVCMWVYRHWYLNGHWKPPHT